MEKFKIKKGRGKYVYPNMDFCNGWSYCIFFLTPLRQAVVDFFAIIWNITAGIARSIWSFLCGATPVAGAFAVPALGWISVVLLTLVLVVILFVGGLYFITGITFLTIGGALGHGQAAFWAMFAMIIWGTFSVIPRKMAIFVPLRWISYWIARPITIGLLVYLAIVGGWWVFGKLSPQLQISIERSGGNKVGEIANSFDKGSLKSEPEMGKFAKVLEDSQIYNQSRQPVFPVQKGVTVLVKDLNGQKSGADSEGMTKVMLPNRYGDFQQGNEGWIPTRKLDWNWQAWDVKTKAKEDLENKVGAEATEFSLFVPAGGWNIVRLGKGNWQLYPAYAQVQFGPEKFHSFSGGRFHSPGNKMLIGIALPGMESGKVIIKKISDQ
jgi:hypothetical protein